MKNLIGKFLAISCLGLLMLSSCKKSDSIVAINDASTKAGTLTVSNTAPNLDRNNQSATALTITTNKTNYGYSAVVTYTLQIDIKGNNFAKPVVAVLTSLSQTFNIGDFNKLIIGLNKPNVSTQYEARILSSLSPTAGFAYSNVVTITATAFPAISYLYVVGAFNGWSTSAADSLYSTVPNIYNGIINFTSGNREFLVLPKKNYDNKYATGDASGSTTVNVGYNASNNLTAPATPGLYYITLNLSTNKITFTQANGYSAIGSTTPGGNYSTDLDLKYINDGNLSYVGTLAFTAGAFKIRQNHDWTFSWGDIATPNGKDLTDNNGGNINVAAAGNYKVTFTIPFTPYGLTPNITATYALVKQ